MLFLDLHNVENTPLEVRGEVLLILNTERKKIKVGREEVMESRKGRREERLEFHWVLILVVNFCLLTSLENVIFPHVQNPDLHN